MNLRNIQMIGFIIKIFASPIFTDFEDMVQWNLDLRKILGVAKIFLKTRFFLISNTAKPLKVTNES